MLLPRLPTALEKSLEMLFMVLVKSLVWYERAYKKQESSTAPSLQPFPPPSAPTDKQKAEPPTSPVRSSADSTLR